MQALRLHRHPGQTFSAVCFYKFAQSIDLFAREQLRRFDSADVAPICNRSGKYLKLRSSQLLREIYQLHTEASVRLIAAVTLHSLFICYARQRQRNLYAQRLAEYLFQQAFIQRNDIIHLYKGEFHIYLSKLRLSVCTEVLIAEAARYLIVSVKAGYH